MAMLTLNDKGSTYYGAYSIVLKEASINYRATAFEENSVKFFQKQSNVRVGDVDPPGNRSTWESRNKLAEAKCYLKVSSSTVEDDFPLVLINPANSTGDDDFIEVHIFGAIHRSTIEKVVGPVPPKKERFLIKGLERKLAKIGAFLEIR
jgi:hypothetical protein